VPAVPAAATATCARIRPWQSSRSCSATSPTNRWTPS
jgi:hypothetical protein